MPQVAIIRFLQLLLLLTLLNSSWRWQICQIVNLVV
jgi:hypothetical protein